MDLVIPINMDLIGGIMLGGGVSLLITTYFSNEDLKVLGMGGLSFNAIFVRDAVGVVAIIAGSVLSYYL